jgi:hypothetical protein
MKRIIIFSAKKRRVGDVIQLGNRNGGMPSTGRVVGLMEDDPKHHNQQVCGHSEHVNTGKDYYYVEVRE